MVQLHEYLLSNNAESFLLGVELMRQVDDKELYEELIAMYRTALKTCGEDDSLKTYAFMFYNCDIFDYEASGLFVENLIPYRRCLLSIYRKDGNMRMGLSFLNSYGIPFTLEKVRRHSKQIRDAFFNMRNFIINEIKP